MRYVLILLYSPDAYKVLILWHLLENSIHQTDVKNDMAEKR